MTLTTSVTERATELLGRRSERRSFLRQSAMVGTAVAAAGSDFILRPSTAYAAICNCNGRTCDCSNLCCDGYTEFCCQIYGTNSCPPNTVLAGWWKVDNSSYCSGAARYYMDCNKRSPNCGCGSSGVCRGSDTTCQCRSCGNRKDGCTTFRYGNCNNQIRCVGPIMCRVVTCTKPWEIDPGCTTVSRTDNNTRYHHRPCLEPKKDPTPKQIAWVKALYVDYLGRSGAQEPVENWATQLANGKSKYTIAQGFAYSDEYINRYIKDVFILALDRTPDSETLRRMRTSIKNGTLPIQIAYQVFGSAEFYRKAGGTNDGFVAALYRLVLGREPDGAGKRKWVERLDDGLSRQTVVKGFYGSIESRRQRVHRLYRRFLARNADPTGLDTWSRRLSNGDDLELAAVLTTSREYQGRAERRFL